MRRRAAPVAAGLAFVAVMVWTARPPGSGLWWRAAFVVVHCAGFASLVWYLQNARLRARDVLVGAVLFRLVALPMLPALSDDGYRYLWDGLVAHEAGRSPYDLRPSDPELASLHGTVLYERMNSPSYYSVYPPLSQALFWTATVGFDGAGWPLRWWLLKGLLVLFELVGIVALLRTVRPEQAALYAWSPLAVIEIAGQGHTEALVIAGIGLVLLASRGKVPTVSLGVTIAGLAKLYPLALLPFAWRREGGRGVAAFALVAIAVSVPVWSPETVPHLLESLRLFFGTFDEFAAPYRLLKAVAYPVFEDSAGRVASGALVTGFAGALFFAFLSDDGTRRALRIALITTVVGFALTASTLHPWYWLPPLFAIPLLENKTILWLCALAPLAYLNYEIPVLSLPILAIGWGGAATLWIYERRSPS